MGKCIKTLTVNGKSVLTKCEQKFLLKIHWKFSQNPSSTWQNVRHHRHRPLLRELHAYDSLPDSLPNWNPCSGWQPDVCTEQLERDQIWSTKSCKMLVNLLLTVRIGRKFITVILNLTRANKMQGKILARWVFECLTFIFFLKPTAAQKKKLTSMEGCMHTTQKSIGKIHLLEAFVLEAPWWQLFFRMDVEAPRSCCCRNEDLYWIACSKLKEALPNYMFNSFHHGDLITQCWVNFWQQRKSTSWILHVGPANMQNWKHDHNICSRWQIWHHDVCIQNTSVCLIRICFKPPSIYALPWE